MPAADGTFTLEYLPPGVRPRLLLYGLPPTLTHTMVHAHMGLRIDLVAAAAARGRVVDSTTKQPLGGALVFCGDAPTARADASGRFELVQLLPGPATIGARFEFRERRRLMSRTGSCEVQLRANETLDDVVVPID